MGNRLLPQPGFDSPSFRAASLPAPERELRFAKAIGRQWRFDYAWPDQKIALEIEGGGFVGGRHSTGVGMMADCEKYSWAAILGWCLVRATHRMIKDGIAITLLQEAFRVRTITTREGDNHV